MYARRDLIGYGYLAVFPTLLIDRYALFHAARPRVSVDWQWGPVLMVAHDPNRPDVGYTYSPEPSPEGF